MDKILLVGAGGFVGAILRYLIGCYVQSAAANSVFPFGTLAVNVSGCFAGGFLAHTIETLGLFGPQSRAFLIIGVLGGYTTFSSFGNETVNLLRDGERAAALLNLVGHFLAALAAVWLGRVVAHSMVTA